MSIRWGHFSDLHFQFTNFGTNLLRDSLLKTLKDNNIQLDYIFITGDILNKGIYEESTTKFIREIAKITECTLQNVIICPGNHDIKRTPFRKRNIKAVIEQREKQDGDIVLSEDDRYGLIERFFPPFEEICENITECELPKQLHYVLKLDKINLYVLNTAVFAGQTCPGENLDLEEPKLDDTNLYICDNELFKLKSNKSELGCSDNALNIAIAHHGVECFTIKEQEKLKNFLDSLNIDLYLCGHVHENVLRVLEKTQCMTLQISCGGLFVDGYNDASFIIGEVEQDNYITFTNYSYIKQNDCWSVSSIAPKPYQNGIYRYQPERLKNCSEIVPKQQTQRFPGNIVNQRFSTNSSIIVFYKNAQQVENATPFEDNIDLLKQFYPILEQKHLMLLDKLFLSYCQKDSHLENIQKLLQPDLFVLEHPYYEAWYELLLKIISYNFEGADVGNGSKYQFQSIVDMVTWYYDILFYGLSETLVEIKMSKDMQFKDIEFRLSLIKNEVVQSSKSFFGYEVQLKELEKEIRKGKGNYVYITGEQFYGKTAFVAKTISTLSCESITNINTMNYSVPWLAHCFAVFGKQATNRLSAISMLVEQINLVLPKPIEINDISNDQYFFGSLLKILSDSLERVVVILDALDEMGMENLELFPETLPENCTVILSSKKKVSDVQSRFKKLKVINLIGLKDEDIYKLIGISKKKQGATRFVNFITQRTKRNPHLLITIAQKIKNDGGEIPKNHDEILTSLNSLFLQFKEAWKLGGTSDCALYRILELLTIFEQVDYLKTEDIQSYLIYLGYQIRSEEILDLLKVVIVQLDTDGEDRFKLKYNAFEEYLLDKYTESDFSIIFTKILDWLMHYSNKNIYIERFFIRWYPYSDISCEKTDCILDLMIGNHQTVEIKNIMKFMCIIAQYGNEIRQRLHSCILKCFDALNSIDDDIVQLYFNYLYKTVSDEESIEKAIGYLKMLADRGNEQAVLRYAKLLKNGSKSINKDAYQAIRYLETLKQTEDTLIEIYNTYVEIDIKEKQKIYFDLLLEYENSETTCIYAELLAIGYLYPKNVDKSLKLLDDLISKSDERAMLTKADLIAQGLFPNYNIEDAFTLWDRASEKLSSAIFNKGQYLFEECNQPESHKNGIKLIKIAATKKSHKAIIYLVENSFIHGRNISNDEISQLLYLIQKEDPIAALIFCMCVDKKLIQMDSYLLHIYKVASEFAKSDITSALHYFERGDYEIAFMYFEKDYIDDVSSSSLSASNMAYMLRRGMVKSKKYDIKKLLFPLLSKGYVFAFINYALTLNGDSHCEQTWENVLNSFKKIDCSSDDFQEAVSWWNKASIKNDVEGDFVIGMLLYTEKLLIDPDEKDMKTRIWKAKQAGYYIPEFII